MRYHKPKSQVKGMHHPRQNDRPNYHAQFGIMNWLVKQGVVDAPDQTALIEGFLKEYNFQVPRPGLHEKQLAAAKHKFISNRFLKFCQYVYKNTEEVDA